ncbi:hypothetical protein BD779DRAFT_1666233 [Infundibulicybe gibba]|nr:hypothetical protein BD779DRAFT_1666233 [Infundibulicybe gibba]
MFFISFIAAALLFNTITAAPTTSESPAIKRSSAYSGSGGGTSGGSVNGINEGGDANHHSSNVLLNLASYNAGNGGTATSGAAAHGDGGRKWTQIHSHQNQADRPSGDSYTGAGGQALGGNVNGVEPGMINILSGNAGNGGDSSSGSSGR